MASSSTTGNQQRRSIKTSAIESWNSKFDSDSTRQENWIKSLKEESRQALINRFNEIRTQYLKRLFSDGFENKRHQTIHLEAVQDIATILYFKHKWRDLSDEEFETFVVDL